MFWPSRLERGYNLGVTVHDAEHASARILQAVTRDWRDWVGLAARLVLWVVLLAAGVLKIGNLGESVLAVRAYQLLPYEMTTIVGYALPIVEIILGVLLILGLFTRLSALAGALLMVAFIFGISSAWARS